eukprot:364649-Chlamydomonas_euryale.AAC.2
MKSNEHWRRGSGSRTGGSATFFQRGSRRVCCGAAAATLATWTPAAPDASSVTSPAVTRPVTNPARPAGTAADSSEIRPFSADRCRCVGAGHRHGSSFASAGASTARPPPVHALVCSRASNVPFEASEPMRGGASEKPRPARKLAASVDSPQRRPRQNRLNFSWCRASALGRGQLEGPALVRSAVLMCYCLAAMLLSSHGVLWHKCMPWISPLWPLQCHCKRTDGAHGHGHAFMRTLVEKA